MKIGESITIQGVEYMAVEEQWFEDFDEYDYWEQLFRGTDGNDYVGWWGHESNGEGIPWLLGGYNTGRNQLNGQKCPIPATQEEYNEPETRLQ